MLRSTHYAVLAALGLFAALVVFGARLHWVEEIGTAERDGFVTAADAIRAGHPLPDPFRPPLFPHAVAALAPLTGSTFVAARLIANLSAAALALLAFGFARRLAAPPRAHLAGGVAFALVAVNPNTWIVGQHTTTDMPFAALAGAALLAALAYMQRPRVATAALAGLAYGLAMCTRNNALALLPGLLAAWWLGARGSPDRSDEPAALAAGTPRFDEPVAASRAGRGVAALLVAIAVAALTLAPKWWWRARDFGSPWHDENWKNLVLKLHYFPDWSMLSKIPGGGSFIKVLVAEPRAALGSAVGELWQFTVVRAPQLLGTWVHVAFATVGTIQLLRFRPRRQATLWLVGTSAVFVVAVAVTFFTWCRFLLVLAPIGAALLSGGAFAAGARPVRTPGWLLLAALIGVSAVKTAFVELPPFRARHPYADVAALRRLERDLPPGQTLAGTSPYLHRYLTRPYFHLPDAWGALAGSMPNYYAALSDFLRARRVGFVVVGACCLEDRPQPLLSGEPAPPGLQLVARDRHTTIWRVRDSSN